jgi:hypothetical protein
MHPEMISKINSDWAWGMGQWSMVIGQWSLVKGQWTSGRKDVETKHVELLDKSCGQRIVHFHSYV